MLKKWSSIGLLIPALLFFVCCGGDNSKPLTVQGLSESKPASSWMHDLPDSTPLSAINIPGTHDSGSTWEWVYGTARCQTLNIDQQLNAGVRFLDIRCHQKNDTFTIYHGFESMNLGFEDVLKTCSGFLNVYWGETIILCVSNEDSNDDANTNSRSFEDVFKEYIAKYCTKPLYVGEAIPTMGEARGKLVLMRRFDASGPLGLPTDGWPNCTKAPIIVQDDYVVTNNDEKWRAITALFDAAQSGPRDTMYLNFTSGYFPIGQIPSIPSVSFDINNRLFTYFTNNQVKRWGRYGIVVVNFANVETNKLIYMTNFPGS